MKENLKVVISGGGTGGHIFPAIAIADALKKRFPEADILFIGAKGRMEMERVPKAGYPIEGLWISGMTKDIKSLLLPLKLTSSINHAIAILKRFRMRQALVRLLTSLKGRLRAERSLVKPLIHSPSMG